MREIVQVQVGQCGVMLGDSFWSLLRQEHGLEHTGHQLPGNNSHNENNRVFFHEEGNNQFVPRSVFVDLDHGPLDAVLAGPLGKFYRADNFVRSLGGYGAGNSWPKGHYTEGADLMEELLDVVRVETERAESLQGFQIVHNIDAGTGSGMGTLLLCRLREEFPDKMLWTWSVTENSTDRVTYDRGVLRPYNNMLALQYLIEYADVVVYVDNDAVYEACADKQFTHGHLNALVAQLMSNVTCALRLNSSESMSLRKISTNLVPFPRQHFLAVGTAPLTAEFIENSVNGLETRITKSEISSQLFQPQNMMLATDRYNTSGKHLATMCSFRGAMSELEIAELMSLTCDKYSSKFVPWIPDNVKWTHCTTTTPSVNMSGSYLSNNTAVIDMFERLETQFSALFRRKAFLHHFCGEGMDEMELTEGHSNLSDLMAEYRMYQNATIESKLGEASYCSDDEVE